MYYPEEVIEQVIAANDIVDVVGQYVHLKRSGSSYMGLCPFHNEKSPSFSVHQGKQVFHCFGCGEGGNVITFLMKYENYSFQEALKVLADRAGVKLPEAQYSEAAKRRARQRDELLAINKEAATYYYRLLRSPKGRRGLEYFTNRALSPETLNRFGLGFADGSSNDMVRHLKEQGFSEQGIIDSGVGVFDEKRGLHDRFFNRVMFPIMDVQNRVIGFGGRVLGDGKPKYLNSPETPVFDKSRNLYGLQIAKRTKAPYLILCEGYMDTIAMHQAGFDCAVASLGTSFTEGQAQLLKRYTKNILLDYDSDGAGVTAAMRNMEILRKAGLPCKVIDMRPAKDADEFMKTEGLGPEEFKERIRTAENAFYYRVRHVQENYDLSDPAEKSQFYHEIARMLCGFDDEIERESYITAMADKYLIPLETLRREVAGYGLVGGENIRTARTTKKEPFYPGSRVYGLDRHQEQAASQGTPGTGAQAGGQPRPQERGSAGAQEDDGAWAAYMQDADAYVDDEDDANSGDVYGDAVTGNTGTRVGPGGRTGDRNRNGAAGTGSSVGRAMGAGMAANASGSRTVRGNKSALAAWQKNERLLLTWLSDDPDLWPQIRGFISSEDFDEGTYRLAAGKYFALLDKQCGDALSAMSGNVAAARISPATVIAMFDDENEQREAAHMFDEHIIGLETLEEREKALRDVLLGIKRASAQTSGEGSVADLNRVIALRKTEEAIKKARFKVKLPENSD